MRADSMQLPRMLATDRNELGRLFKKARSAKRQGLGLAHRENERLLDLYAEERRETDELMTKWAEARAQLLDLNKEDKMRLLDLLLTARIRQCE